MQKYQNRKILGLFIILLLFVSHNSLLRFLPAGFVFEIIPAFYFGLVLFYNTDKKWLFTTKQGFFYLSLIFAFFILIVFNKKTGREIDFLMLMNSLLLPVFISLALDCCNFRYDFNLKKRLKSLINIFVIVNSSLAIFERLILYNFIPMSVQINSAWFSEANMFRSSALWGHGLAGAFVTTILIGFILTDKKQNLKKRLKLFFLGVFAVLCFNSRFFIVWNILFFAVVAIFTYFNKKTLSSQRNLIFLSSFLFGIGAFVLIVVLGIAGRLTTMGLYDESSSAARLEIFSIFNYYKISDFILGIPESEVEMVYYISGLNIINENAWIIFLMRFGLVFSIPLIVLYAAVYIRIFSHYPFFFALMLPLSFLISASTFNSITTREGYLAIFTLCAFIYQPIYITINEKNHACLRNKARGY